MIDFVKIIVRVPDVFSFLHKVDDIWIPVNIDTDETVNYQENSLRNIKFLGFDSGTVIITGSIHKYSNDGDHNHDDFSYLRLSDTIHDIFDRFEIPLDRFKLQNVEFGVNITPPAPVNDILNGLMIHKKSIFLDKSVKSGNYKQVEHRQYYLKAYNKGEQYNQSSTIMRWEIKVIAMEYLAKYSIKTLQDLLDKNKLMMIGNLLAGCWTEVLLTDPTSITSSLIPEQHTKFLQWSNINHWRDLLNPKDNKYRNKYSREVLAFRNFTARHSQNTQQTIRELIINKWNELLQA